MDENRPGAAAVLRDARVGSCLAVVSLLPGIFLILPWGCASCSSSLPGIGVAMSLPILAGLLLALNGTGATRDGDSAEAVRSLGCAALCLTVPAAVTLLPGAWALVAGLVALNQASQSGRPGGCATFFAGLSVAIGAVTVVYAIPALIGAFLLRRAVRALRARAPTR